MDILKQEPTNFFDQQKPEPVDQKFWLQKELNLSRFVSYVL
jgi:hypothetical protein